MGVGRKEKTTKKKRPAKKRSKAAKRSVEKKTARRSRPAGRPRILTAAVQKRIETNIRDGAYSCQAAVAAGVSSQVFYVWMARGRDELERLADNPGAEQDPNEAVFVEFLEAIEKARAEAEQARVKTIKTASKKQWQAAAWLLERQHPDRWGRRDRHEITGAKGGPVRVQVIKIGDQEIEF